MPAIVITKQEALGLLVKWKSDATPLAFLFDLADENGKSKLTGHWEGLALSMTGSGIVTDLTDSALLLRTIDNQHSVIVSLETAVFAYIAVGSNRQRCHAANGSLAPLVSAQTLKTNEILCPEKC